MTKNIEEGQLVLATVTRIIGTSVFVHLDDYNLEGTVSFPEIAPGRIRNIRDYAFPGKKIILKVLRITSQIIELSLRRVKVNERNDFNERYKKEKSYTALLKTIIGEKAEETITNIKQNEASLFDLLEASKENPKLLEKYLAKDKIEKIIKILSEKKVKEAEVSKRFSLSSKADKGILLVKKSIEDSRKGIENLEVSYIAAGKYLAKIKSKDLKLADQQIRKFLENLESFAKKNSCEFNEEKS
jgi:translation initiation factor 2 alpha subunit (eIF-2alpha)